MSNLWKNYRKLWTLVIFIGLVGGVYYFGILKLIAGIENKNLKIKEVSAVREYRQGRMKDLPKFRNQQGVIGKDEKWLRNLLNQSDKEAVKSFIESIEALAEKTGSQYETISLSEKVEAVKPGSGRRPAASAKAQGGVWSDLPDFPYMRLEISASGQFANVYDFLRRLENMPYLVDVVSLKMIPADSIKFEPSSPSGSAAPAGIGKPAGKSVDGEYVTLLANLVVYTEKKTDE